MTQYPPSPYQPPQPNYAQPYPYPGGPNPLAPSRRASLLLFILGGLGLTGGLCCGVVGAMMPQLISQQPEIASQLPPEITPNLMQMVFLVMAGLGIVFSIAQIVLGLFVRKGSKPATITAIVLVVLSLLYLALSLVQTLLHAATGGGDQQGPASAAMGACFIVIPAVLYGLLLAWLIQALRNLPAPGQYPPQYWQTMQQQYAQQAYQQWQQQQQQQQQQGGYAPPTPPAGPPVDQALTPPPPPTFGPNDGESRGPDEPK